MSVAEKPFDSTFDASIHSRRLIEEWLPIAEIGIESLRERTPMTPFPAPNRLHVWWARRPLVASRAAILASLLPAGADHEMFVHLLGIHGDPVAAKKRLEVATRQGIRLGAKAYGYRRAFTYTPDKGERTWIWDQLELQMAHLPVVLDPTAGGGSIPFETVRLGLPTIANDLNPVAWLILKTTVELPATHGEQVRSRFLKLGAEFVKRVRRQLVPFYPDESETDCVPDAYLWARTITCPYCGGLVPLSPNWRLNGKGMGVRLAPQCGTGIMPVMGDAQVQGEGHHGQDGHATGRRCRFDIVTKVKDHSEGTVTGGDALCPFPDCGRVIDGDEIKRQAQAGQMGQQLYCVVFKKLEMIGRTKAGKDKLKKIRGFRAPRPEDDVEDKVRAMLDEKMPEWIARNIVPTEAFPDGANDSRPLQYGMPLWRDMFAPRQLLGHGTSVEVFHELVEEAREKNGGEAPELDKAALVYLAIAIDKMIHYNAIMARWHAGREVLAPVFDRHDFSFKWSYGEMAPTITGLGYDWAVEQTGKALKELIGLCSSSRGTGILPAENHDIVDLMNASEHSSACCSTKGDHGRDAEVSKGDGDHGQDVHATILCGSADAMALQDGSVDAIVMDPPYYDNVMYAELADFFYVWLKRTAGLLYPERFYADLTDKDHEAVANPAKFKGQAGGAKNLAGYDYQSRMAAIFRECRRVLKPGGVMTVMFTHKASGAWDALATGLVLAGFTITASWPIQTEAEGSLHIKDKNAAKSTIFLVCRPKETERDDAEPRYWEEIEPQVTQRVREHVSEFQEAGISGVDLYLACFGPALQVFSENWPVTRGRPVPKPDWFGEDQFNKWDPYAAKPEDALDAARGEVKRWRMEQLATVKRQHHIDPLTEWFILAWDAFRAPKFPADEALKLARVAGLDFDAEVRNHVCEVKGSDVILWDSLTRRAKGKLGAPSETVMLDTLHQAAAAGRKGNTGAARKVIEDAGLLDDPTLLTALEALLNVLPPVGGTDFEALEKLRELAFREKVPESGQLAIFVPGTTEIRDDLDGVEQEEEDA